MPSASPSYAPYPQAGALGFVGALPAGSAPPMPSIIPDPFSRAVTLPAFTSRGDTLLPGQSLATGEALTTKNGGVLLMQGGNLVLYGSVNVYGLPVPEKHKGQYMSLWWANSGSPATKAVFNSDGSFFLVDDKGNKFYSANSKGAVKLVFQTDGNAVWYGKDGKPIAYTVTNGWAMNPALRPKSSTGPFDTITGGFAQFGHDAAKAGAVVTKIPLVGDAVKIVGEVAAEPFKVAGAIASGERLDHVALGAIKDQIKIVKDVAPYAQTVVSLVPGVGSGVAAAVGAGMALAEGQSITAAAKAAIRGAIPGGAVAQTGFDLAMKVASGENVGKAALETARAQLPAGAQQAFDVGLAVATGENLQKATIKGLSNLAASQIQGLAETGLDALKSTPGLADAYKSIASSDAAGAAARGFTIASGVLAHARAGAAALATVRAQLKPEEQRGFDAAVATQAPHGAAAAVHTAAVAKGPIVHEPPKKAVPAPIVHEPPKKAAPAPIVHEPPKKAPTGPKVLEPTAKRTAAVQPPRGVAYGPYPKMTKTGVSAPPHGHHGGGHGGGHPGGHRGAPRIFRGGRGVPGWDYYYPLPAEVVTTTEICRTWGDLVPIPPSMVQAVKTAIGSSGGRPTTMRGDDGALYLFTVEDGGIAARRCVSFGVGDWNQWKQAASDAWNDWSSEAADLWRNF